MRKNRWTIIKSCVRVDEWTEKSCVRADGRSEKSRVRADEQSENSCVRADGSDNSCVQTEDVQKPCGRKSSCVGVWKNGGVEIISKSQRNRMCQDAGVKPIVRDPMIDDRDSCRVRSRDDPMFDMSLPSSKN